MTVTFWTVDGKWWERDIGDLERAADLLTWGRPFEVHDPRHECTVWLNPATVVHFKETDG